MSKQRFPKKNTRGATPWSQKSRGTCFSIEFFSHTARQIAAWLPHLATYVIFYVSHSNTHLVSERSGRNWRPVQSCQCAYRCNCTPFWPWRRNRMWLWSSSGNLCGTIARAFSWQLSSQSFHWPWRGFSIWNELSHVNMQTECISRVSRSQIKKEYS